MSRPEYSIIIPTHGRPDSLMEVLDALEKQVHAPGFEVIVVVDGDTGSTASTMLEKARPFSVTVETQLQQGPAVARNRGMDLARGDHLAIIGDDTIPDPRWLSTHHERRTGLDHPAAIIGKTRWHNRIQVTPFLEFINEYGLQFGYSIIEDADDLPYCFFYTSNLTVPRNLIGDLRFCEDFPYAAMEDIELGYRLQSRGMRIAYAENALVFHSHQLDIKTFVDRQERVGESAAVFFEKHPELRNFLGVPNNGSPPLPEESVFQDLVAAASALENSELRLHSLWLLVCQMAYNRGLARGLGLQPDSDPQWTRRALGAVTEALRAASQHITGAYAPWTTAAGQDAGPVPRLPEPAWMLAPGSRID